MSSPQLNRALALISEAYLIHLVTLHRRPVYRHENGDIALNAPSIAGFIDGYLAERWSPLKRTGMYMQLLNIDAMTERGKTGYLVHWGEVPQLKPRGIRFLDAMFRRFGEMVQELGGEEVAQKWVEEQVK